MITRRGLFTGAAALSVAVFSFSKFLPTQREGITYYVVQWVDKLDLEAMNEIVPASMRSFQQRMEADGYTEMRRLRCETNYRADSQMWLVVFTAELH